MSKIHLTHSIFIFVILLSFKTPIWVCLYHNHPYAVFSDNFKYVAEFFPSRAHGGTDGHGAVYKMEGNRKGPQIWEFDWYAPPYTVQLSKNGQNLIHYNGIGSGKIILSNAVKTSKYDLREFMNKPLRYFDRIGTAGIQWVADYTNIRDGYSEKENTFTVVLADQQVLVFDVNSGDIKERSIDSTALRYTEHRKQVAKLYKKRSKECSSQYFFEHYDLQWERLWLRTSTAQQHIYYTGNVQARNNYTTFSLSHFKLPYNDLISPTYLTDTLLYIEQRLSEFLSNTSQNYDSIKIQLGTTNIKGFYHSSFHHHPLELPPYSQNSWSIVSLFTEDSIVQKSHYNYVDQVAFNDSIVPRLTRDTTCSFKLISMQNNKKTISFTRPSNQEHLKLLEPDENGYFNSVLLDNISTMDSLISQFGKSDSTIEYRSGEVSHIYSEGYVYAIHNWNYQKIYIELRNPFGNTFHQ